MNYICKKSFFMIHIEVSRANAEFGFEASDQYGHTVQMDTSPETGGQNFGVRPMQMLLMGLGGCSGIDIISILKKQRQTVDSFHMIIDGERASGIEPSLWKEVSITFELKGKIEVEKATRACELSIGKYCSVAATLREAGCQLKWKVKVN
jgi:putative redox protein